MKVRCKLRNLLPDDTRIVELTAAISIIISTGLELMGVVSTHAALSNWQAWLCASALAALVQFFSLVFLDKGEVLRVYSSLVIGGLLVYLGIVHTDYSVFSYVTQITLGIANLYAFLVNNQRLVWNSQ